MRQDALSISAGRDWVANGRTRTSLTPPSFMASIERLTRELAVKGGKEEEGTRRRGNGCKLETEPAPKVAFAVQRNKEMKEREYWINALL